MPKRLYFVSLAFFLVSGCNPPSAWREFHGHGPNDGFIAVNSARILLPRWTVQVDADIFSSPVVGPDGTIYVGSFWGELVAVTPAGSIKWKTPLGSIISAPAVGLDQNIYVISVSYRQSGDGLVSSTLHKVTPSGRIIWSHDLGGVAAGSSPKTWSSGTALYIFVYVERSPSSQLVILDQDANEIHREAVCGVTVVGGWSTPGGPDIQGPDPTLAIVDYTNLISPNQPIIAVAANSCGITAYTWNPPNLVKIWNQTIGEDLSSPAVSNTGVLVVGKNNSHVVAYDVKSGVPAWDKEYDAGELVLATPAIFFNYVYVASLTHIHVLDINDGSRLSIHDLGGRGFDADPAVTANRLYVSTGAGLYSFSADSSLSDLMLFGGAVGVGSAPAIGPDGTVYVVTQGRLYYVGVLNAFPPHGTY